MPPFRSILSVFYPVDSSFVGWMSFVMAACMVTGRLHGQSINDQLYGSVVESGHYRFTPEQKVYLKNRDPGRNNSSFDDFWLGASTVLQRANLNSRGSLRDGALGADVSTIIAPNARLRGRQTIDSFQVDPRFLHVNLGPVFVDQFLLGAGTIWADETGTVPSSFGNDGWGALAWVSMRVSLLPSDNFIISLRPSFYWASNNNQTGVGWGINPFTVGFRPSVVGDLRYDFQVSNWDFQLFDRLATLGGSGRVARFPESLQIGAVDRVGRYPLRAGGQINDFAIEDRTNLFDGKQLVRLYNNFGISGETRLTDGMIFETYISKLDALDSNLKSVQARIIGGASVRMEGVFIKPFATYGMASTSPYELYRHQVHVGSGFVLRHDIDASASVGYMTTTGSSRFSYGHRERWLGQGSLQWQMTPFTSHTLVGGRRVLNNPALPLSLNDFIQYQLLQQIGFRSDLSFIIGTSQRQQLEIGRGGGDGHVNYAGMMLESSLTESLRVSLASGYENLDLGVRDYQFWMHRLNAQLLLSETVSMTAIYQYTESAGSISFMEHALFLSLSKMF